MSKLKGWWRLWLFFAVLACGFATFQTVKYDDLRADGAPTIACIVGTASTDFRHITKVIDNPDYTTKPLNREQWIAKHGEFRGAVWIPIMVRRFESQSNPKAEAFDVVATFRCSSWLQLLINVGIALAASLLFIAVALAIGWVVRGFRQ